MASFHDAVLGDDLLPLVLSHARREVFWHLRAMRAEMLSSPWSCMLSRHFLLEQNSSS